MGKFFKKIGKFLMEWHEIITLPIALLIWVASPFFLRFFIDPTASTFDGGVLQIIYWPVIAFMVLSAVAWLYFKITFRKGYKFFDILEDKLMEEYKDEKNSLTIWQKSVIVLWFFSLFLFCLVLLARVL